MKIKILLGDIFLSAVQLKEIISIIQPLGNYYKKNEGRLGSSALVWQLV